MKKEFPGHFSYAPAEMSQIWNECLFVLDANVLLSLYRYSDSTRAELLRVFDSLKDRLWIPHQVAFEYLNNRLSVIGEQIRHYDDAVKKTEALRKSLESSNQHPFVSTALLKRCADVFDGLDNELQSNKKIHDARIVGDEIKEAIEGIFAGRVGTGYSKERTEEIIVSGKARYDERIPPGFHDVKKGGDSPLFADRCRPYGDYIVWLQIIEKAKQEKKPVVFVTGDVKDDWWLSAQGKTIGPQPQLIEEFLQSAGAAFHMYKPEVFLEKANNFLEKVTSEATVDEIRNTRIEESELAIFDEAMNRVWPSEEISLSALSDAGLMDTVEGLAKFHVDLDLDDLDLPWNEPTTIVEVRSRLDELAYKLERLSNNREMFRRRRAKMHRHLQRRENDAPREVIVGIRRTLDVLAQSMVQVEEAIQRLIAKRASLYVLMRRFGNDGG